LAEGRRRKYLFYRRIQLGEHALCLLKVKVRVT
jgi:hypothetical protein